MISLSRREILKDQDGVVPRKESYPCSQVGYESDLNDADL